MAKKDEKGAETAPLFPLVDGQPKSKSKWKVITPFYDVIQKRVVQVGEIVEHNQKRVDYNLIEKA